MFILLAVSNSMNAQSYEIPLAEKTRNANLIIEGKVQQSRVMTDNKGDIYTIHTVSITAVLKGISQSSEVEVINWGGETETEIQTWSHFLALKEGDYGIFTLYHNPNLFQIDNGNTYSIYSDIQGFIRFSDVKNGYITASDPFNTYRNIEKDCYEQIEKLTGQKIVFIPNNSVKVTRSGIRYNFKDIYFDGKNIKFNIFVSSLIGDKKLFSSGLIVSYNTNTYGSSIVSKQKMILQNSGISVLPNYKLNASDVTVNQLRIELKSVGSEDNLITIGENEQLLLNGSLEIENIGSSPDITFDLDNMYALNTYYENNQANIFSFIQVNANLSTGSVQLVPKIKTVAPLSVSAGTDDIITIIGTGFGTTQGTSYVEFTNAFANSGWMQPHPSDYKSWNDTEVKVRVPSISAIGSPTALEQYAGTGYVKVSVGNLSTTSTDKLIVRYSVTNIEHNTPSTIPKYITKTRLVGSYNQSEGYTLYYDADFKALLGAVPAFERALCTWIGVTNVNFIVMDQSAATAASNLYKNYACKISLTDILPPGTANTTVAKTPKTYNGGCDPNSIVSVTLLSKFEMLFRKSTTWYTKQNYDPTLPLTYWEQNIDLESVALHELGHAQLLLHTNNDDVMFWLIQKPRRTLSINDIEGGKYMRDLNTTVLPQCKSYIPMKLLPKCISSPTKEVSSDNSINIFPNPTDGILQVDCDNIIESVIIINSLGEIIIDDQKINVLFHQSIDTENLSSGLYCIKVKSNIGYSTSKFIKL